MSPDIVSRTLSIHQEHELMLALERAGLRGDDAQNAIDHKDVSEAMVWTTRKRDEYAITCSPSEAAAIMGGNFHSLDVTERHLGVKFMTKQKKVLATVPFGPAVLQACSETHILVACGGVSLLEIWQACNDLFYIKSDVWYKNEHFATTKVRPGWYLVRKNLVPYSTSKTWDEQVTLLGPDEQVPSAAVLAQTILIHCMETEERLFGAIYVRSSDVISDGNHVYLGSFVQGGLGVYYFWDGGRRGGIGLASAWKSS